LETFREKFPAKGMLDQAEQFHKALGALADSQGILATSTTNGSKANYDP
jgi:hypothetical protein